MDDIFLYAILGVLVWGRLWQVIIYGLPYYSQHPLEIFMVWKWGMSFIGWIIGVVSSLVYFAYKNNVSATVLFALWDLVFIPTTFWIAIWRIGNFLNQELYWLPISDSFSATYPHLTYWASFSHFFHVYPAVDNLLRLNTNFLSSLFEWLIPFIIFVCIFVYKQQKKTRSTGLIVWLFFVWYSIVRFFFEYLRADSQLEFVGWFTKSQWFFLLFSVTWIIFLLFRNRIFKIK
jgi:phosphatidylglycerol:prolipoprotein diacylglycerol transferase